MDCLVATGVQWAVMYRMGYSIKSILVCRGQADNCNQAGDLADGTSQGKELLANGYQQIIVMPVV